MLFIKWLNIYLLPLKKKKKNDTTALTRPGPTQTVSLTSDTKSRLSAPPSVGEPWSKESSLVSRDTLLSAAGKDYKGVGMASLAAEGGGVERGRLQVSLCCSLLPPQAAGCKSFQVCVHVYHVTEPTALDTRSFCVVALNEWLVWSVNFHNKAPEKKKEMKVAQSSPALRNPMD